MIRAGLTGSAANAYMRFTAGQWLARSIAGSSLAASTIGSGLSERLHTAPGWVRLVREGNLFSAYQSAGRQQLDAHRAPTRSSMPSTVYVGLGGHQQYRDGDWRRRTFSNVTVRRTHEHQQAAYSGALGTCQRRDLHGPRQRDADSDRRRRGRLDQQGRLLRRHAARRIRHVEPVQRDVEQRRRRELQPHRGRDGQRRRDDHVAGRCDHRERDRQQAADRGAVGARSRHHVHCAREHHAYRQRPRTRTARSRRSISTPARSWWDPTRPVPTA